MANPRAKRRLRFSLRSILIATVVVAAWAWYATRVYRTTTTLIAATERGDADRVEQQFAMPSQGQLLAGSLRAGYESVTVRVAQRDELSWRSQHCLMEIEVRNSAGVSSRVSTFSVSVDRAGAHLESYDDGVAIAPE